MYQSDYLVEFAMVARERSFSKAALKLSVSQSSLSRHVRSLETQLGLKLLDRRPEGAALTEDGRFVCAKASEVLDALDEVERYARSRTPGGSVKVCGVEFYPQLYRRLRSAVGGFKWQGRRVEFRMVSESLLEHRDVAGILLGDEASFCIATELPDGHVDALPPEVASTALAPAFPVAVMEAENPLAGRASLTARDLEGRCLIHADSDHHHARRWWSLTKELLRETGVRYVAEARTLERDTDYYDSLGESILLLPCGHTAIELLQNSGRAALPVEGLGFVFALYYRTGDELARAVAGLAPLPTGEAKSGGREA